MRIATLNIISTLTVSVLLCLAYNSNAQDCLEYAEIDGPECAACVPSGWTAAGGTTPDVIPDDGTWPGGGCLIDDLSGASPGGGNMVMFVSQGSSYQEGMTTTVSGLSTNQEYGFGLYWEEITVSNCGMWEAGELILIVDGEEYEFSGAADWEFIEICFTPSSSSVEIELMIGPEAMGAIVVDSPSCDDVTPCCPLKLFVDELEYSGCPGDAIDLLARYEDSEGGVTIEWTCDPTEGLNYLSAIDEIAPQFLYPESDDFEGETFKYTLTIEDDNCQKIEDCIEIEIASSIAPEFEIFICEIYDQDVFPNESLNGYTGFWEGDFDFDVLVGTLQEYTFFLDPGQDNCIESYDFEFFIEPAVDPTFDFNTIYCILDDERYDLPDESLEGIEGEWFTADDFRPSNLGIDVFIFEFIPYVDEYCAFNYIIEIEVLEADSLEFNLPSVFCTSNDFFVLPEQSLDGVFGYWDVDSIDLTAPVQEAELSFIPEDVNDCYYEFEWTYSVGSSIIPSFDLPDSLCTSTEVISFSNISLEGNEGTWTPATFQTDTIANELVAVWTPNASDNCSQILEVTIPVIEQIELSFNLPDSLCATNEYFVLPTLNNISGEWNLDSIRLNVTNDSLISVAFQPEDECYSVFSSQLFIQVEQMPAFNLPDSICSGNLPFQLPPVDINNIAGIWTIPEINESSPNNVSTTFNVTESGCWASFEYNVVITDRITPVFNTLPQYFCENDSSYTFTSTSMNGVEGSWTIAGFDPNQTYPNNEFATSFIPLDQNCSQSLDVLIPVLNFDEIDYNSIDPTSCSSADGQIIFNNSFPDLEYSLDGNTWNAIADINNLEGRSYRLEIRYIQFPNCSEIFEVELRSPNGPQIENVNSTDITNCDVEDGTIEVIATGDNLEFSLDGIQWQISNVFDNLEANNYTVYLRSNGDNNCIDQESVSLNAPIAVQVININKSDLSDCALNDGTIEIEAEGENLEYSIDAGISWQSNNIFENLDFGLYNIQVRNNQATNCQDETTVEILPQDLIEILEVNVINVSSCASSNGSIEIICNISDVEYSIDNGMNWSTQNRFDNLPQGSYEVIVRIISATNCTDSETVQILAPQVPDLTILNVIQSSDCISSNAVIEINTNISQPEFSIDMINWQNEGLFDNLSFGDYIVYVRDANNPDCINFQEVNIERSDCPCNDLIIDAVIDAVNCVDPISGSIEISNISGFYTNESYSLEWNNGSNELLQSNLSEGVYNLNISYDLNCEYEESFIIGSIDPLTFGLQSFDQDCVELGSIEITSLEGGSGSFQFSLDNINFQSESVFFNLTADEYAIFIDDFFNCTGNDEATIDYINNLELELPVIPTITQGQSAMLNPLINQASIDSFEWFPKESILNPGELIAEVAPEETTEYTLVIYFGECSETRSVLVEVNPLINVYIPNIINVSDTDNIFFLSGQEGTIEIEFMNIYDRWGNLVFQKNTPEINNPNDGWDGRYEDNKVIPGVYTYYIQLKEELFGEDFVAGSITVLY